MLLDEVRSRLRTGLGERGGASRAVGRVEEFTARLRWKGPLNNPFRTELGLVFEPEEDETRGVLLHGVSDITAFGRFMLIALSCLLLGLTITVRTQADPESLLPWALAIVGACAIGAVYAIGREVARGEHDHMVGFVARTLDARVVREPVATGRRGMGRRHGAGRD